MKLNIKYRLSAFLFIPLMLSGCASIPPEAVVLSQRIGEDLQGLHKAHRDMVQLYYAKMRDDVSSLIDEVYAPFVMRYALSQQADEYKAGRFSVYEAIEDLKAGTSEKEEGLKVVLEFMEAANQQISAKKDELLTPLLEEEQKMVFDVNSAYENTIKANQTITNYLVSLKKIKESQQRAMSLVGLDGVEAKLSSRVLEISEYVENALKEGRKIDLKQGDAFQQVENVIGGIQKIINNKKYYNE